MPQDHFDHPWLSKGFTVLFDCTMTSLADDLLRSRTIPELRELVNSLEKDSGSKKTELQHMVGSKYHDFIQSADKIAAMKEKSLLIDQQIQQFWNNNQQLLAKAQTILTYSQPQHKKLKKQQSSLPVEGINSATVWTKLNDCNVFDATKLVLLARSLCVQSSVHPATQSRLAPYFDASTSKSLQEFASKLGEDTQQQLTSTLFLSETIADDANMLLLCDPEPLDAPSGRDHRHGGMAGTSGLEILNKARAIAGLSLLSHTVTTPQQMLQVYLSAAEVRVQDLLETHLTVNGKNRASQGFETDAEAAEGHMGHGITAMVKLLQQTIMDVHLLFLISIDPSAFSGLNSSSSAGNVGLNTPVLGLVGYFQRVLLVETSQHLLQYIAAGGVTANGAVSGGFDLPRAFAELTSATTGAGSSAALREQRKVFKSWLEGLFARVTTQCKVVLSSLTSAAEVAQLQQQVWAACVNISDTHAHPAHSAHSTHASHTTSSSSSVAKRSQSFHGAKDSTSSNVPSELTADAYLATLYTYNQHAWESASEMLLTGVTGAAQQYVSVDGTSTAHTYLWCGVFRPCFLHQVERLLKHSCDEVLAHTKLQILRTLRQQGVTLDPHTLKITSPTSEESAKTANMLATSDFAADASQLSSPRIYQLAEKIRQQFEQDISRLLADVVDPVQSTEVSTANSTTDLDTLNSTTNSSAIGGDSADPQSIGALARAMRTQCAQLVGHTLVLIRNLVEACQKALRDRAALPARGGSGSSAEDLYECLRGDDVDCILTPDLLEIVKRNCGSNFFTSGGGDNSSAIQGGTSKGEGRRFERADHSLLSSLLFLGRVSWLFKIRGTFLEYALQPKAALLHAHGGAGGGGLGSASADPGASSGNVLRGRSNSMSASFRGQPQQGGASVNEDQFRSAFEIADTNGDGVLSFAEAVEALQAISGEGDTKSSSSASSFNLSAQLTPTLTYTEFALICGSTLLSSDAAQPVLRLQRALEHVITTAHVTWAVCTVHMLGRNLRAQYLADLGFAYSSQSTSSVNGKKTTKKDDKNEKKPFKVSWVAKWMDLDGSVDDDGGAGGAQKEQVLIPGGMCASLRVFLHKVSQHGTTAVVSIDTMQTASATVSSAKRGYSLASEGVAPGAHSHTAAAPVIRDEFSDLLGEVEEVQDSEGEEEGETSAFFESSGLLTALAGGASGKVVLSHLANRLLAQLSLAYVSYISTTVLNEARNHANTSSSTSSSRLVVSNEALEEASLQCVFDLSVSQLLADQWGMPEWRATGSAKGTTSKRRSTEAVGLSAALAAWTAQLDPITAELVLPLVRASTQAHMQGISLLAPHGNSSTLSLAVAELSPRPGQSAQNGAKNSEQLLARVFPGGTHSAPRFSLLPLAISTNPVPVAASGRNTPAGPGPSAASARSGAVMPAEPATRAATPAAAVSTPVAANAARSVMNWFG